MLTSLAGDERSWVMRLLFLFTAVVLAGASGPAQAAESYRDCADCPLMVTVPGGSFSMGSSPSGISSAVSVDETPQHDVAVKQFAMSVTEVTRDQFDAFVRATGHQAGGPCLVYSKAEYKLVESNANDWRDPGFSQGGNHPVVCVNWNDAKAYVRWLSQKTGKNYRLPTEAEWEYAARAGTATPRYLGWDNSSACRNANVSDQTRASAHNLDTGPTGIFHCTDGYVYTAPVAQFQANAFGLNDMLGNVWEWTEDCHNTSYNGAPTNGSAWLTGDCSLRVVRGGSWLIGPWLGRSAFRVGVTAAIRNINLGFRVSRTN
jgi:formylglycine-generating enzyme required for sulfatase activity